MQKKMAILSLSLLDTWVSENGRYSIQIIPLISQNEILICCEINLGYFQLFLNSNFSEAVLFPFSNASELQNELSKISGIKFYEAFGDWLLEKSIAIHPNLQKVFIAFFK